MCLEIFREARLWQLGVLPLVAARTQDLRLRVPFASLYPYLIYFGELEI